MINRWILLMIGLGMGGSLKAEGFGDGGFERSQHDSMFVLDADNFRHHVDFFNTMEPENIVNYVSNQ